MPEFARPPGEIGRNSTAESQSEESAGVEENDSNSPRVKDIDENKTNGNTPKSFADEDELDVGDLMGLGVEVTSFKM